MDDKLIGVNGEEQRRQCKIIVNDIFRYATGHVKGRMQDKHSLIKYYCPILLSTEESIIDLMKSSSTQGQFFRMFEIPCKLGELTISKEHSQQLESFMGSHHGVAGEKFAQWLLKNGMYEDKLKDKFHQWHEKIVADFGEVAYADRMANRMAIIMMAGELLNESFDFGINLNEVQDLLMKSVNIAFSKANEKDSQLKKLKEYISNYNEYFCDRRNNCERYKHLGLYKENAFGHYEIRVCKDALAYILSGKEPQDYLDYLEAEDAGEALVNSKKAKPINPTDFIQLLRTWRSKGILISGRKSGITSAMTSQETLFNNDRQRNVYIIQFKEEE